MIHDADVHARMTDPARRRATIRSKHQFREVYTSVATDMQNLGQCSNTGHLHPDAMIHSASGPAEVIAAMTPREVGNLADEFLAIVFRLQEDEHASLATYFAFTEAGLAAVLLDYPTAQSLADVGKDTLMQNGVSELNAVLLTKIAGACLRTSSALLH